MTPQVVAQRITAAFSEMPPRMRKVGTYVLDHPEDVALLSMREQARRVGVPPAAMTRFAQRIGYAGYDEMRGLFAASIRGRISDFSARAGELAERRARLGEPTLARSLADGLIERVAALAEPERLAAIVDAAALLAGARHHLLSRPPLLLCTRLPFCLCRRPLRRPDPSPRRTWRHRRRWAQRRRPRRRAARGVVRALHPRHRRDRHRRARARLADRRRHRQPRVPARPDRHPHGRGGRATLATLPTSPRRRSRRPRCWRRWSSPRADRRAGRCSSATKTNSPGGASIGMTP